MSSLIYRENSKLPSSLVRMVVVLMMVLVMLQWMCKECSGASMVMNSVNTMKAAGIPTSPILSNRTDEYYQEYVFLGKACKGSTLGSVSLYPVYKTSESCFKTRNGSYQKSYCTSRGFVIESACLEGCNFCAFKSERYLFPQCTVAEGIASTIRICGKLLSEDLPKMLWNVEYDNCENKKIISAKGSVTGMCEWSLVSEPSKPACNSTDYSVEKFTGSETECNTRIGVSAGKVNTCAESTEYKCQ